MAQIATSLKLPGDLKERLDHLGKESGASAHAYMLSALQAHAERAELAQQFLQEAIAAAEAMQKSAKVIWRRTYMPISPSAPKDKKPRSLRQKLGANNLFQ